MPIYLAAMMLGAHVAVPFFTPYMLRDLHLDYATYAGLTAIAIVVKALIFPLLHPLSERFGMRAVLACGAAWSSCCRRCGWCSRRAPGLALVQALSGMAWGGVEYAELPALARERAKTIAASSSCRSPAP